MAIISNINEDYIDSYEFEKRIKECSKEETEHYLSAYAYYLKKRIEYEMVLQNTDDYNTKREIGMGFLIALEQYKNNHTILDFMARCMLMEILNEIDLEIRIRKNYDNPKEILDEGIKGYIINTISIYDIHLSNYIQIHIDLITPAEEEVRKIIDKLSKQTYDPEILEEITQEFVTYNDDCMYDSTDLLHYLKYSLGIDCLKEEYHIDCLEEDEEYYIDLFNTNDLNEQRILMKYSKLIREYLDTGKCPDWYIILETEKRNTKNVKYKSKVTKLNNSY